MSKVLKSHCINVQEKFKVESVNFENELCIDSQEYYEYGELYDTIDNEESYTVEDANFKAEQILLEAKEEALKIVNNAKEQAEEIIRDGISKGELEKNEIIEDFKNKALEHCRKLASDEVLQIKNKVQTTLMEAEAKKSNAFIEAEAEMIELIVKISEKILDDALAINPNIIIYLIRKNLDNTSVTGDVIVHVSEEEFEFVNKHSERISKFFRGNGNVSFIQDKGISMGDCIIETDFGSIDCSLKNQFIEIKKNLYYISENR